MNKKFLLMLLGLGIIGEFSASVGTAMGARRGAGTIRTPDRKTPLVNFTDMENGRKTEVFSMGSDLQFSQDDKTYSILNGRCLYANGKLNLVYLDPWFFNGQETKLKFLSSNTGTQRSFFARGHVADSGNCYIIYVSPENKTKVIPLTAADINSILMKKIYFAINNQYIFQLTPDKTAYLIRILTSPMGDS